MIKILDSSALFIVNIEQDLVEYELIQTQNMSLKSPAPPDLHQPRLSLSAPG